MRISFIQIADEVHYEPGTAQLAGMLKDNNWMPWHVRTDYATIKDQFLDQVGGNEPICVAFRVTKQTREMVHYLASALIERAPMPVFFYGPLCQTHPEEVVGLVRPSVVLTGDPEVGLKNFIDIWPTHPIPETPPPGCWYALEDDVLLKGEDGGPYDVTQAPKPDLVVFGGDRIFQRGIGASMFGELKVAPMLAGVGSPKGLASNNNLLTFGYPTQYPPRLAEPDRILFRMRALGPRVHHYEFWDREFGHDIEHAEVMLGKMHKRQKKKTYSLRALASSFDERLFDLVDERYFRRLIVELDAPNATVYEKVPGLEEPEKVYSVLQATRDRGFEPAVLCSVGLPFETEEDINDKVNRLRDVGITRVRFIPWEPRYGHPSYPVCEDGGLLEDRGESWNREVWRPLKQDCLDNEGWWRAWQKCMDLHAEVQLAQPARFAPLKSV